MATPWSPFFHPFWECLKTTRTLIWIGSSPRTSWHRREMKHPPCSKCPSRFIGTWTRPAASDFPFIIIQYPEGVIESTTVNCSITYSAFVNYVKDFNKSFVFVFRQPVRCANEELPKVLVSEGLAHAETSELCAASVRFCAQRHCHSLGEALQEIRDVFGFSLEATMQDI